MSKTLPKSERPKMERVGGGLERQRPTLKKRDDPDFESMFDGDDDNPLADVTLTDDLQANMDEGMSAALQEIIQRKKATQERFRVATDSEFFFCLVFQSRDQKDDFLRLIHWEDLGDKYLNGLEVARRLNIPLQVVPIEPLKIRGKPAKFQASDLIPDGQGE